MEVPVELAVLVELVVDQTFMWESTCPPHNLNSNLYPKDPMKESPPFAHHLAHMLLPFTRRTDFLQEDVLSIDTSSKVTSLLITIFLS